MREPEDYIGLEVSSDRFGSGVVADAADDGTLVVEFDSGAQLWTDTALFEAGL